MPSSPQASPEKRGLLGRLRGRRLRYRMRYPADELMDWWLGVSTSYALGYKPTGDSQKDPALRNEFVPFSYLRLFKVFRQLELSKDDVLVDLGSGLGRVVFAASWYGVGKAVGVEFDGILHAGAEANLARRRAKFPNVVFRQMYAEEFDFSDVTAVTLYHSFGPGTLKKVLDKIELSWRERPRRIRFAYINPRFEHVLAESSLFRKYADWPAAIPYEKLRWFNWYRCGIAFYETPATAPATQRAS